MAETKQGEQTRGYGYKDKGGNIEYGKITEAAVNALKARIGVERSSNLLDWEIEDRKFTATRARRFAMSAGDYNPLYLDMEYARKSPYGTIVVPPATIMGIEQTNAARDGMPGLHAWFRGTTIEWKKPLLIGDVLIGKTYLTDVRVVPSRTTDQAVIQEYENKGFNRTGEHIASVYTSWHRAERETAKEKAVNQKMRGLASYSPEDIKKIQDDYANTKLRGSQKLFFEDVSVGDEIWPLIKGPTSPAQRSVGEGGGGGFARGEPGEWSWSHKQVLTVLFERHPGLPFVNEWGIPEVPVVIHNSNERCQRYLGLPGAYDAGYQRINWSINMLTNWGGDYSFLHKLSIRFPVFNVMGDTTWLYGKVNGKRQEGKLNVLEIEVWNQNQLGFKVTEGSAEIIVPSKANPDDVVWKNL
ncbi:MAG: MaoC family dehydratase N-terminal domain-containing protein [Chloroflexi bacterium]|nr:MaoC family dehydratase N-terminal domain-containing protein [Chloroflexota bacterium]